MNKTERGQIHQKYDGRCAYCGKVLTKFHIDHKEPLYRGWTDKELPSDYDIEKRISLENLVPACPRCNLWKKTFSVEEFRKEIENQISRLRKYSPSFCLAEDFNIIKTKDLKIEFWFEKHAQLQKSID